MHAALRAAATLVALPAACFAGLLSLGAPWHRCPTYAHLPCAAPLLPPPFCGRWPTTCRARWVWGSALWRGTLPPASCTTARCSRWRTTATGQSLGQHAKGARAGCRYIQASYSGDLHCLRRPRGGFRKSCQDGGNRGQGVQGAHACHASHAMLAVPLSSVPGRARGATCAHAPVAGIWLTPVPAPPPPPPTPAPQRPV